MTHSNTAVLLRVRSPVQCHSHLLTQLQLYGCFQALHGLTEPAQALKRKAPASTKTFT